ncbi:hypothetical protein OESDEN_14564, partial [Oesophagostomum dentatum]
LTTVHLLRINKRLIKVLFRYSETIVRASFREYPAWSVGDNYLDFGGAEVTQGLFNGRVASGTPLVWSTNVES